MNPKLISIALLTFVSAVSASAVTATLAPTADAGIRSQITTNTGTTGEMLVGVVASGDIARSVLAFDLSSIPVGATIDSVSLSLVTTTKDGSSTFSQTLTLNLHQLTETFTNTGVTWTSRNGTNAWTTFGGTFNGTVLSSISADPTTVTGGGTLSFNSTSNLTSAVGSAIGGTLYLITKLSDESGTNRGLFRFNTVDASGTSNDPVLTINYTSTIPEPSTYAAFAGFAVLGGTMIVRRRRLAD